MKESVVVLHNVRSAHNVGSIFRTADAAGASRIVLTGYTPTPIDRFGRAVKEIEKTALGAEKNVPWTYEKTISLAIKNLRKENFSVVGVELDARAVDYRTYSPKEKTAFIFGNEVRGLSPALRRSCDALVQIPMRGKKESLNVAVAAGVILFALQ